MSMPHECRCGICQRTMSPMFFEIQPQPQYREPTLADAHDLYSQFLLESNDGMLVDDALRTALKINGFVRKVQP